MFLGSSKSRSLTGGDSKSLRAVHGTLKKHQWQMDATKPITIDRIIEANNPEKTLQNVTDYLYQNLGNLIIKIPLKVLPGRPVLYEHVRKKR